MGRTPPDRRLGFVAFPFGRFESVSGRLSVGSQVVQFVREGVDPVAGRFYVVVTATPEGDDGLAELVEFVESVCPVVPITLRRPEVVVDAVELVAAPALDDAPFAVLNGDTLCDERSLTRLFEGGPAVGSYRVDDPT